MYKLTALYLYKAVFMFELLIAESLMCIGMKRRPHFAVRIAVSFVVCMGFSFALPVLAYNALYCSAVFLLMFVFSLFWMKFCFDENLMSVLFRGFAAYTVQHIAYQIYDLTVLAIGAIFGDGAAVGGVYGDGSVDDYLPIVYPLLTVSSSSGAMMDKLRQLCVYVSYFFIYISAYSLGFTFASRRLKDSDKFELKKSVLFVFVVGFALFNVIVSSVITYYADKHFDALYVVFLALYNILCSFFTMYFMFEVVYRRQLKQGFLIANRLLKQSEQQYELAKTNIELINLKCHDLKHQIHALGSGSVDKSTIAEIENMISVYDASIRTGNEALDIILTEKSLYCNKRGIRLYCIVDGTLLTFMSAADLYSLFGNILDNAIEAVENLEEGKRFINLSVKSINGFITVSEGNCLSSPLVFDEGLPLTTKENTDLHGYGMKSIRLICKRYNGELNISQNDGMFDLSMVFMR